MIENESKKNIWILEDDDGARFVYNEVLSKNFNLNFYSDLKSMQSELDLKHQPDVLIADLRLPDGFFLDLLEKADELKFPFIVVSSVDDGEVLESCFAEGASDYLTKPFSGNELLFKMKRLLDTHKNKIKMDTLSKKVFSSDGQEIQLTPKEMHILHMLKSENGRPKSRSELISAVWNRVTVTGKTLDVHIFNLRRKIKAMGMLIVFNNDEKYVLSSDGMVDKISV